MESWKCKSQCKTLSLLSIWASIICLWTLFTCHLFYSDRFRYNTRYFKTLEDIHKVNKHLLFYIYSIIQTTSVNCYSNNARTANLIKINKLLCVFTNFLLSCSFFLVWLSYWYYTQLYLTRTWVNIFFIIIFNLWLVEQW